MISLLETAKRLKAMADTGLLYAENEYDKERYEELHGISEQLIRQISGQSLADMSAHFVPAKEYPTPKIDIRGLILNENQEVLMVKEKADSKWALPGGWGEIGFTPSEVIEKEIKEETGLESKTKRLLAVFDKKCHPHPPQIHYVYKMVFLCEKTGGTLSDAFDIEEVSYFNVDKLPTLSKDRILESQIQQVFEIAINNQPVFFN